MTYKKLSVYSFILCFQHCGWIQEQQMTERHSGPTNSADKYTVL